MSILNAIKSKLDTIKSWLNKPKPFYLKIPWVIISTIIVILFGMFITTIYQPQINNFVDKYIYHKEPSVDVTLNQIYGLQNDEFINMSDLPPGEYQLRFNNFIAMTFSPDNISVVELKPIIGGVVIDDKGGWAIGRPFNYIDYNRTVIQNNCLFFTPTKVEKGQSTMVTIVYDTTDQDPQDTNYLKYSLLLANSGNKEINNYRADVCLREGLIKKVDPKYNDNFIKQSAPNCVGIRIEKFLPGDPMRATFYADAAFYNADLNASFNSYDENGKILNEKFTQNVMLFLPNCTLISPFGTVTRLKVQK